MSEVLQFLTDDRSVLPSGNYTIQAETKVSDTNHKITDNNDFSAIRTFTVSSPKYALLAGDIVSVFPPENHQEGYSDVLPHVVLAQSSRPWERSAETPPNPKVPWLAVLVFTEVEAPKPKSIGIDKLMEGVAYPPPPPGEDTPKPERVAVIDVEIELLKGLLPAYDDLSLLCHVRKNAADATPAVALVIGNRIPLENTRCVAHLVSIEGRYDGKGFIFGEAKNTKDNKVRLITLHNWSFHSSGSSNFSAFFTQVTNNAYPLQLPAPAAIKDREINAIAKSYNDAGCIPLLHQLRSAESTISFYRGPLSPTTTDTTLDFPVQTSDALLFYNDKIGMFDVSYAAAWELGRLLCLQDKQFSLDVYNYKRKVIQSRALQRQFQSRTHLPLRGEAKRAAARAAQDATLPDKIKDKFNALFLLEGVPFNYLVPNGDMLPAESLRFFTVDTQWTRSLIAGAFSIGGFDVESSNGLEPPYPMITGFLLRSEAIANFPEIVIEAKGTVGEPPKESLLESLGQRKLSSNVMLCMFAGKLQSLTIGPAPTSLHFAFEQDGTEWIRKLRDDEGKPNDLQVTVPFREDLIQQVVEITQLANDMGQTLDPQNPPKLNAADFAFQMIEGSDSVFFSIGTDKDMEMDNE